MLLVVPALATAAFTVVVPLLSVVRLSFYESNYLREAWVGFGNYIAILRDAAFGGAVFNSVLYGLAFMAGTVGIGLPVALYSFDLARPWRNGVRLALFLPTIAAGIIISQVWLWVFSPRGGLANYVLGLFGLEPVRWFSTRPVALAVLCFIMAASVIGAGIVLLMGALSGVPTDALEAAKVDGARPGQVRWLIAAGFIRSTILLQCLLAFLGGLQVWEFVYAMTNGGPAGGTQSLMYFIYNNGLLRGHYGYASAATVVLLVVALSAAWVMRRVRE